MTIVSLPDLTLKKNSKIADSPTNTPKNPEPKTTAQHYTYPNETRNAVPNMSWTKTIDTTKTLIIAI